MLVDLAEARHGGELGFVDTLLDLALIVRRRARPRRSVGP